MADSPVRNRTAERRLVFVIASCARATPLVRSLAFSLTLYDRLVAAELAALLPEIAAEITLGSVWSRMMSSWNVFVGSIATPPGISSDAPKRT